jgi:hypothetical protein
MDIFPIIPDEPVCIREPYNLALAKIIRDNEYNILDADIKAQGSSIKIELYLKHSVELFDKLQEIKTIDIDARKREHLKKLETVIPEILSFPVPPKPPPPPPPEYQ